MAVPRAAMAATAAKAACRTAWLVAPAVPAVQAQVVARVAKSPLRKQARTKSSSLTTVLAHLRTTTRAPAEKAAMAVTAATVKAEAALLVLDKLALQAVLVE